MRGLLRVSKYFRYRRINTLQLQNETQLQHIQRCCPEGMGALTQRCLQERAVIDYNTNKMKTY